MIVVCDYVMVLRLLFVVGLVGVGVMGVVMGVGVVMDL